MLAKELQEAFEQLFAGARGASEWGRLYRLPRAAPRFDVGRYREIARFERIQVDQRASGRRLYFAGDNPWIRRGTARCSPDSERRAP